jgi:hypothetical protein
MQQQDKSRRPIPARDKTRLFFFTGLLASAILYSAYNLYVLDPYVYNDMDRYTRHIYKFGSIIIAWLIGFATFRRIAPAWLRQLWNILYTAGLCLLLLLAGYDFIHPLTPTLRQPISTFHEALISPIPYVVIGLLNFAYKKG